MHPVMKRPVILLFALLIAILFSALSFQTKLHAHPLNNGYSQIEIQNKSIQYDVTLPESGLMLYDTNKDKRLSMDELLAQQSRIEAYMQNHLEIEAGSERLKPVLLSMENTEETGVPAVLFHLRYASPFYIEDFTIHYTLLFDNADQAHVNFAYISKEDDGDQTIFNTANRTYKYEPLAKPNILAYAVRYFVLGMEHILTGSDHLLFLLLLILPAVRLPEIAGIVTSFTIAHSLTLFLAAAGYIHVNSHWIESGIALTIAYAAVHNRLVKSMKARWLITFCFGLVHGMGFAGALSEIGLPEKHLIGSLLSFNIGVESGQLGIVLLLLPLLARLQRLSWYPKLAIGISGIVFGLSLYWFRQRLSAI